MTVTILVPVYGVEKYIEQCAESLFSQTYKDIKYVFCDDCSPDSSIEVLFQVLAKYPERRNSVKIIKNDTNLGLGGTRRHLFEYLDSELFMLVDSDDYLPFDAVDTLVEKYLDSGADIIDGAYRETGEGRIVLPYHGSMIKYRKRILCQGIEPCRIWGKLYRTSVIGRIGGFSFDGIDMAEDLCITSRLVDCCSRTWVDKVSYVYRTDREKSYSNNIKEKDILSYIKACNIVYDYYHKRKFICASLEIGMLNVIRQCRKNGFSIQRAKHLLDYHPSSPIFIFLYKIIVSNSSGRLSEFIFKTVRTFCTL